MNTTVLVSIVGLLVALSVASERLVEIIKGSWPYLSTEKSDPAAEGRRQAGLQLLAVLAGIATAFLARPAIPDALLPTTNTWAIIALGLLASGGSGFWNSILSYVLEVKNLKESIARDKRLEVQQRELQLHERALTLKEKEMLIKAGLPTA